MKKLILLLMLGIITPLNGKTLNQNLSKGTGSITFNRHDFPVNILSYPTSINKKWRAKFDETKKNRMFMHTFQYNIPKGCRVTKATLSLKIKNLASAYSNDILGIVGNGRVLFKTTIWKKNEGSKTIKKLSFNLARLPKVGSLLNSLNDGDFSFYIQDDTSVDFVKLVWTQSCQ